MKGLKFLVALCLVLSPCVNASLDDATSYKASLVFNRDSRLLFNTEPFYEANIANILKLFNEQKCIITHDRKNYTYKIKPGTGESCKLLADASALEVVIMDEVDNKLRELYINFSDDDVLFAVMQNIKDTDFDLRSDPYTLERVRSKEHEQMFSAYNLMFKSKDKTFANSNGVMNYPLKLSTVFSRELPFSYNIFLKDPIENTKKKAYMAGCKLAYFTDSFFTCNNKKLIEGHTINVKYESTNPLDNPQKIDRVIYTFVDVPQDSLDKFNNQYLKKYKPMDEDSIKRSQKRYPLPKDLKGQKPSKALMYGNMLIRIFNIDNEASYVIEALK